MKATLSKLLSFLVLVIILISCGKQKSTNENIEIEDKELPTEVRAQKALYDEVMAIHDEAMKQMEKMMHLKGQLQERMDLARENQTQDVEALEVTITALEEADEAMMQWMRDFDPKDADTEAHEEIMAYYKSQRQAIAEIKDQMDAAIGRAEALTDEVK